MGNAKMLYTNLLLVFFAAAVHAQTGISSGNLELFPPASGTPPLYSVDPHSNTFKGPIVAFCDGRLNSGLLEIELLIFERSGRILFREKLSIRGTPKPSATAENFKGTLEDKILNYTLHGEFPCSRDGLGFTCLITAVPNRGTKNITKTLDLTGPNSRVTVYPLPNPAALHNAGQAIKITCNATVTRFVNLESVTGTPVEWKWEMKDSGKTDWVDVPDEIAGNMVVAPPTPESCRRGNSSVSLEITLQKSDHQRTYRCSYKNRMAGEAEFNTDLSESFNVGFVRELIETLGEADKREIVYTMSSLIGMILGIISFLMVSCLGALYTYRKNRGGKKYDIVKNLLQQEEEELDRIEASLGVGAMLPVAGSEDESMAESSMAESSVVEDSVVESSVVESSVVESSVAETSGALSESNA